jgi:hypothetical protein
VFIVIWNDLWFLWIIVYRIKLRRGRDLGKELGLDRYTGGTQLPTGSEQLTEVRRRLLTIESK